VECLESRTLLSLPSNLLVDTSASQNSGSQDTQSETSMTVSGTNVVVAYNDSSVDTRTGNHFTNWSVSTNKAQSFTTQGPLPKSTDGDAGDPVLAPNLTTGALYFSTLGFNAANVIQFFTSNDNGVTFGAPVNSAPGFSGSSFLDKDWMAVDNFSGSGQGNIYQTFTDFASTTTIKLTKSTDGGVTWGPSGGTTVGPLAHTVQGSYVTVGPDHTVYVFYLDGNNPSQQKIMMSKSTDLGNTFSSATTVVTLKTTGSNGDLGLIGGFRTNAFPHVAINKVTGAIYVAYNDRGQVSGDKSDVYFTQSTNNGSTWSAPIKVNDDATTTEQYQPDIAVTPDGTRLFMGWYDDRLDSTNMTFNWFGATASISGGTVTFGTNFQISTNSSPIVINQDPVIASGYMGDYDQSVGIPGFFLTTWGDNSQGDARHAHQPDVRFSAVSATMTGPARILGAMGDGFDLSQAASLSPLGLASASTRPVLGGPADTFGSIQAQGGVLVSNDTATSFVSQQEAMQIQLLDLYWQAEFHRQ
jgi:hypothetical protein